MTMTKMNLQIGVAVETKWLGTKEAERKDLVTMTGIKESKYGQTEPDTETGNIPVRLGLTKKIAIGIGKKMKVKMPKAGMSTKRPGETGNRNDLNPRRRADINLRRRAVLLENRLGTAEVSELMSTTTPTTKGHSMVVSHDLLLNRPTKKSKKR